MTSINKNQQQYKNPSVPTIIGGVMAGGAVNGIAAATAMVNNSKFLKKMIDVNRSLSEDEFKQVNSAIDETMKKTKLPEKGVNILRATKENTKKLTAVLEKEVREGFGRFSNKCAQDSKIEAMKKNLYSGNNAFYCTKSKQILLPEKGLDLTFFHEAGHAINANFSKLGKTLQKCRQATLLAIPISLIALWKTKKAEGEEPTSPIDKATTFIKENAGKLTFATFLPMIAEEGLATLRGNKLAKQVLSPELAKKVAKSNAFGGATYLALATLSSLGLFLGVKVKDSIAHKKVVTENQ